MLDLIFLPNRLRNRKASCVAGTNREIFVTFAVNDLYHARKGSSGDQTPLLSAPNSSGSLRGASLKIRGSNIVTSSSKRPEAPRRSWELGAVGFGPLMTPSKRGIDSLLQRS